MAILAGFAAYAVALPSVAQTHTPHAPISIAGNASFDAAHGVTGGNGTITDPYRIEGWEIDASSATGIDIRLTTAYFSIRNVYIHSGISMGLQAISFQDVANGTVENSTLTTSTAGVSALRSTSISVFGNILLGNSEGIGFYQSNGTIRGNDIETSPVGIHLQGSTYTTVSDNRIFLSMTDGILAEGGSANVTISGNWIARNGNGIRLLSIAGGVVEGNAIGDNSVGIFGSSSNAATIRENAMNENGLGIDFQDSTSLWIERNTVSHSPNEAIYLSNVQIVTLNMNTLAANEIGLDYYFSGDARAVYNSFLYNAAQVIVVNSYSLVWDDGYPSGGNYWSDYPGLDSCRGPAQDDCTARDGFGDTPYSVAGGSDPYPRMTPFPEPIRYALYGVASAGWGFGPTSVSNPGPVLLGVQGLAVDLAIRSNDTMAHRWFVDLNDNQQVDSGEPASPAISPGSVVRFVFTPVQPGVFTYRCAVHAATMTGRFEVHPAVENADRQGPSVAHAPVTTALVGQTIVIEADVTDNIGVRQVTLYFRTRSVVGFQSVAMTRTTGDTYHAELRPLTSPGTVDYYIEAEDIDGYVTRVPGGTGWYTITVARPLQIPFGLSPLVLGGLFVAAGAGLATGLYLALSRFGSRSRLLGRRP